VGLHLPSSQEEEDEEEEAVPVLGKRRDVEAEEDAAGSMECQTLTVGNGQEEKRRKGMVTASKGGMSWSMLLSTEALEDAHLSRASSVTDAHVLRRKGRLKEQDGLIEFIISMHSTHSAFQVMEKMERWVVEHLEDPIRSTLSRLIPSLGRFYTPLPLVQALQEYDEFASLSRRRYVPPNFAEIRHVLNIAQVHAIAEKLSLLTFDADGTLYADGHHIQRDNKMITHIIKLMQQGVHVAIVTAAGYPGHSARFEDRLAGLLEAFADLELPCSITRLFHVMGGECNYLLQVNSQYRLEFVPDELWKPQYMLEWMEPNVQKLLDDAECALQSAAARLRLPIHIVRKPRAVGAVPKEPTIYEVLEEMALTVQVQLVGANLPFCAFNGGSDVFVDVGNKSIGLGALMKYLGKWPHETMHVGDRFTVSGNDSATRSQCSILWVANPEETAFFTRLLLKDIRLARLTPYLE
jgi:IMP and pyridine-specific 5'-nucleotidase